MNNKRTNTKLSPGPTATRARILKGAAEIMAQKGLHMVAVRDILEAADVSRRTFYQYFADIDALLLALHEAQNAQLITKVGSAIASATTPPERLIRGVDAYLNLQAASPIFAMIQAEAIRPDSVLAPGREQTIQGMIQVIAQTHKALYDVELDTYLFRTLIVGIEGLTLHTCRKGAPNAEERDRVQSAVQHVLRSVLTPEDAP
jgi:AcrR family transcriptional regulator